MSTTRFTRPELVFMLAVPLGWVTLSMFHPNPTNDIYDGAGKTSTRSTKQQRGQPPSCGECLAARTSVGSTPSPTSTSDA